MCQPDKHDRLDMAVEKRAVEQLMCAGDAHERTTASCAEELSDW